MACAPGDGPVQTTPVSSGRTSISWAFSRAGGFAEGLVPAPDALGRAASGGWAGAPSLAVGGGLLSVQWPLAPHRPPFPFESHREFVGRSGLAPSSFADIRSRKGVDRGLCLSLSDGCASVPRGLHSLAWASSQAGVKASVRSAGFPMCGTCPRWPSAPLPITCETSGDAPSEKTEDISADLHVVRAHPAPMRQGHLSLASRARSTAPTARQCRGLRL